MSKVQVETDIPQVINYVATTVNVGSTATLASNQNATVTNVGTESNAILNFGIPRGKSAYEQAVAGGYQGTEQEFNAALASDITTVANNISDINTVGSNIANVNTVANNTTNIDTVAGIESDITTVSGISTDVTTVSSIAVAVANVAANESDVQIVSDNMVNVNTVANSTNMNSINTVAGIKDNVNTVANIYSDVTTAATNAASISTVATNISNVNAVAANESNINAVNSNKTNIDSVAGNATNINAVAGNATNINAVNANKTNIDAVAGNNTNITTVATNISDVTSVATAIADVSAVADDLTDISAVADDLTNIDLVAGSLPDIQDKQNKTLDTPITVDGVTQTTVEAALGAINTFSAGKQDALVSGTNIKTVNNNSLLGSGNINIDSLPSQTGNNGKFLTTNGSSASWAALPEVNIDGNSITKNSDNELQAVAVIEQNNSYPIKEWVGTKQEYNSIQNKDSRTRYEVTDETDATSIVVDSALSNSSENPLQNKAIYTAMQAKQDVSNLVTSVSSSSTDAQYPSAKLFYDTCGDIETLINAL